MESLRITPLASWSPHKLFQSLWSAIEAGNDEAAQTLVDTLAYRLQGNQILAASAIMELIQLALHRRCSLKIKKSLASLPGFSVDIPIKRGKPGLIDFVKAAGDAEFASYLLRQRTAQPISTISETISSP